MIGVVCPSYGQECGVAEYTKNLFSQLPDSSIVKKADETFLDSIDALVIQHENSLWPDDQEVCQLIHDAKQRNIVVQMTVHTIQEARRPWDKLADIYVAMTGYGMQLLIERDMTPQYLPIGCEAPLQAGPAKGKTVGAFGFYEIHKRYPEIANNVIQIPDANMVLYSFNRTLNENYDAFELGIQNYPIVAHRAFYEQSDLLQRLSSECDLLVFWYKQQMHASASAAVRIGLATGRPIITSNTTWFADLGNAVYRPNSLYEGIINLLADPRLYAQYQENARNYCEQNSWPIVAEKQRQLLGIR